MYKLYKFIPLLCTILMRSLTSADLYDNEALDIEELRF